MKTTLAPLHSLPSRGILVPCLALALSLDSASAQQTPNYAPPAAYQQQPGYGGYQAPRPSVGQRVGGLVKRLFYGESQTAYAQPQGQGQSQYRSNYQPGRSLDAPPSSYRQAPRSTQQTMSSMPPSTAKAPTAKPKSTTSSTPAPKKSPSSKYTPPRIKPEAPAPKSAPKPAPKKVEEQPPAPMPSPAPSPAPSFPATYTPPSLPDTPASLNNKPSDSPTTLSGLTSTLPGADTDSTSAITPSKPSTPTPQTETPAKDSPAPTSNSNSNSAAGQFLIGKKTATPGRVISPYPPHQELDVSGLTSGSLALDPTTDKVFQIP